MLAQAQAFPWADELQRTVLHSLVSSFRLGFLQLTDEEGGNVDTIHNARQRVGLAGRIDLPKYVSRDYHDHPDFKAFGKQAKADLAAGRCYDAYSREYLNPNDPMNRDHVISGLSVNNDRGRILAGLSGPDLANRLSNLQATHETINKSKNASTVTEYTSRRARLIRQNEDELERALRRRATLLATVPDQSGRAQHQHMIRKADDEIAARQKKIARLTSINDATMLERDAEARAAYDRAINHAYYTSGRFWHATGRDAATAGARLGVRQVLGLFMAEVWFELRVQLPALLDRLKAKFCLSAFMESVGSTLRGIWARVRRRMRALMQAFKDGVVAGMLGSVTSTLINVFKTTMKGMGGILRTVWAHGVKVIKLIAFNPDRLDGIALCQAVTATLTIGVAAAIGEVVTLKLAPLGKTPFTEGLADFAGSLVTGIVTLGLTYFLLHSETAGKVWAYINQLIPYGGEVIKFREINAELDRYLVEFSQREFAMDPAEVHRFVAELQACNDESDAGAVLEKEAEARGIELPFEMNDLNTTRRWLVSKV